MNFFGVPLVNTAMNLALVGLSLAFGIVATGTLAVQRNAKTCTHHDHTAGIVALLLSGVCGALALATLTAAFLV